MQFSLYVCPDWSRRAHRSGRGRRRIFRFQNCIGSIDRHTAYGLDGGRPLLRRPQFRRRDGKLYGSGNRKVFATINYSTTAAIGVAINASNPSFVVRRTSPAADDLISGLFPLLNVNVALLLELRAILGNGTVNLAGDVELTAGDVIGLFYVDDGLTIALNLGGADAGGIVWSIHRIA